MMKMGGFHRAFLLGMGLLLPPMIRGEKPPPLDPADQRTFADRRTLALYANRRVEGEEDGCPREGECRDPVTGECAGVWSCLVDPCETTDKCDAASCESNFCGGCHALCPEDSGGVPVSLGGKCQTGPAADEAFSCAKGLFCKLEEEVCNNRAGVHFGTCQLTGGSCDAPEDPVCGCDQKTYPNECEAHSAGVSVSRTGACEGSPPTDVTGPVFVGDACEAGQVSACGKGAFCQLEAGKCGVREGTCAATGLLCPTLWDPVCSCEGVTYSNKCEAHSAGFSVDYVGECGKAAPTGTIEEPSVSLTLGNSCEAGQADVCGKDAFCQLETGKCGATVGTCAETLLYCMALWKPVCGCDEKTYSNECEAHSAGVSVDYVDECDKAAPTVTIEEPSVSLALGDSCESGQVDACGKGAFCQLKTGICNEDDAPMGVCSIVPEFCNKKLEWVCGCDGETYSNECMAHEQGVSVSYIGECEKATPGVTSPGEGEDGCREGECRDPVTGECAGVWSCLVDPCETTDKCDTASCESNFCGGCHALCPKDSGGVPMSLGGKCQTGPAADEAFSCAKGLFCKLEEEVCNNRAGVHFGTCRSTGGSCDAPEDPVCGCDQETYPNECEAHSAGVSVSRTGACEGSPPTDVTGPVFTVGDACEAGQADVCGKDAFCQLETGKCGATAGTCAETLLYCMALWKPVCGCDEKTYSNECEAHSAGVSVEYVGECDKAAPTVTIEEPSVSLALGDSCESGQVDACGKGAFCQLETGVCDESDVPKGVCSAMFGFCDSEYDPVCGCDGRTHSNECVAHSAGISVSYNSECEKAAPTVSIALGDACEYGPTDACGKGAFCQLETGKCGEPDVPKGACIVTPDFCTEQYDPVCGCDGGTYSNECKAQEQGISVSYSGKCKAETADPIDVVPEGVSEGVPEGAPMEAIDPVQHQAFADELTRAIYFNDNECSSALGVSMAFSLIYPGSTEEGLEEISDTFYFPADNMQLVWEETTQRMLANADGEDLGYAVAPLLSIANSVWFDKKSKLDKGYQSVVGDYAMQTKFEDKESPYVVNEWVSESTNGLIDSIVPEDKPLFPPYVLIAVNSIYLKATWGLQFKKRRTNLDSFYDSFSGTAEVSEAHFMHMVEYFKYSHEALPGYQITSLPFEASEMSMIFVLPLSDGSEVVSSSALIAALDDLRRTRVALALPKFNFESEYDEVLKDGLFQMGVSAPFTEGAGALCGLFEDNKGCENIYLGKVVQKTVIDVNEEGVEAAAVTALGVGITSAPTDNPVTVMLDHPFQFFIYDKSEGVVLFEGRVGAPEVPEDEPAEPLMESKHSDIGFWQNTFGVVPEAPPAYVAAGKVESVVSPTPPTEAIDTTEASVGGGGESVVSSTPPVETVDPTEAAGLPESSESDTTKPTEAAESVTTQPTDAAVTSDTQTTEATEASATESTEATGESTTQSTEADGASTTQPTEAAAESNIATGPTEPALLDPDPSSGNISRNRSFSLCACVFLASIMVFAR